ncbi:MAG: hypothetical protein AABX38_01395 [Candidatus Micrarchaeota archaeon]
MAESIKNLDEITDLKKIVGNLIKLGEKNGIKIKYAPFGVSLVINRLTIKELGLNIDELDKYAPYIIGTVAPILIKDNKEDFSAIIKETKKTDEYQLIIKELIEKLKLKNRYEEGAYVSTSILDEFMWSINTRNNDSRFEKKKIAMLAYLKFNVIDAQDRHIRKNIDFEIGIERLKELIKELEDVREKLESEKYE